MNKLDKVHGQLCILGFVSFLLFPRKLILVKIYLDFYYCRWKTSKRGHKECFLQGSPLNVQKRFKWNLTLVICLFFSSRGLGFPVRRMLVRLPLGLQRGLSQSPSQEHRGSPSPGIRKFPGDEAKPRLEQDISLQVGVRISEENQGQKLYRDVRENRSRVCDCWDCPGVKAGTAVHLKGESRVVYS